jgi:hypothetical protein
LFEVCGWVSIQAVKLNISATGAGMGEVLEL